MAESPPPITILSRFTATAGPHAGDECVLWAYPCGHQRLSRVDAPGAMPEVSPLPHRRGWLGDGVTPSCACPVFKQ